MASTPTDHPQKQQKNRVLRGFSAFPELDGGGEPYRIICTTSIAQYRRKPGIVQKGICHLST